MISANLAFWMCMGSCFIGWVAGILTCVGLIKNVRRASEEDRTRKFWRG